MYSCDRSNVVNAVTDAGLRLKVSWMINNSFFNLPREIPQRVLTGRRKGCFEIGLQRMGMEFLTHSSSLQELVALDLLCYQPSEPGPAACPAFQGSHPAG